jgi:hypothetical protein
MVGNEHGLRIDIDRRYYWVVEIFIDSWLRDWFTPPLTESGWLGFGLRRSCEKSVSFTCKSRFSE